jgi:glutathione peroxidase
MRHLKRVRDMICVALTLVVIGSALSTDANAAAATTQPSGKLPTTRPSGRPLEMKIQTIDGTEKDLSDYRGSVVLIVNVASKCGYTPQYAGLQKLYETYRERGLVILAVPSNDFNHQEPGSNQEIHKFAVDKFHVTFPMTAKLIVKGPEKHSLYKVLTDPASGGAFSGEIEWNFTKLLVGRDGRVVARFPSKVKPEDPELVAVIEAALKEEAPTSPAAARGSMKFDRSPTITSSEARTAK